MPCLCDVGGGETFPHVCFRWGREPRSFIITINLEKRHSGSREQEINGSTVAVVLLLLSGMCLPFRKFFKGSASYFGIGLNIYPGLGPYRIMNRRKCSLHHSAGPVTRFHRQQAGIFKLSYF